MYEELHLISFDMQLILPELCIDLSVKFMLKVDFWNAVFIWNIKFF